MKKFFNEVKIELKLAAYIFLMNLKSAMELRTAFILQVIGMMVNNIAFVIVWVFFFQAFGSINNWSAIETIGLQGILTLIYGINFTFAFGASNLPEIVNNGTFDNLLVNPRNLYLRILTSDFRISAIGDFIYGAVLVGIYAIGANLNFMQILLLLLLIPACVLIMVGVSMCSSLISFYFPDSTDISRNIFEVFFSPSLYPAALYQGVMRFVFLFIIPSLAIAGFPVEIIRDINPAGVLVVWGIAIVWLLLSIKSLSVSIKRYESGNLLGARSL